ncbi:MAG TPA: Holliday junction resolvase RuvX [Luteibaculaceae bacterium]|nr:Holliday junction resolvase RuvX [Luteibaculaceae bacterium]
MRAVALDFGLKRTGIAVTDELQLVAGALRWIESDQLMGFLDGYMGQYPVEVIVLGKPMYMDGTPMEINQNIDLLQQALEKRFSGVKVVRIDERFTSKQASQTLHQLGVSKKQRQQKGNTDVISAVLLLQGYLQARGHGMF